MVRPLRITYPGAVYHVMNRGQARRPIFLNERDYQSFIEIIEKAWRRWRFELYAYCLMGNHYHLCLKTPESNLARIMRQINGVYTQWFNRNQGRDGPLFRGRYKAMLIEEEEYLAQVVRYIHLNPVEAELVKNPEDYTWSSHQDYSSRKSKPWLAKEPMRKWFPTQAAFHKFVLEGSEKTLKTLYQRRKWPVILGSEDFIEEVRLKSSQPHREHVREERRYVKPSAERILTAVAETFGVPLTQLLEGGRGQANEARQVALWALQEFGDYTYGQISKIAGLGSERTVGWACHVLQKKAATNQRLKRQLKKLETRIRQQRT